MLSLVKEAVTTENGWGKLGFLEELKDDVRYYANYNYNVVGKYILSHNPEDFMIYGKIDITRMIFPIIRKIVAYTNWTTRIDEPNLVKIEDPEKFVNYVIKLWKEYDAELIQIIEDRKKHGINLDYEAEMCAKIVETINYILKKDENGEQ